MIRYSRSVIAVGIMVVSVLAASAWAKRPPAATAFKPGAERDGAGQAVRFPGHGLVWVQPLRYPGATGGQRCTIDVIPDRGDHHELMIVPEAGEIDPDTVPVVCLGIKAFGKIALVHGDAAIGVVYRAYSGVVMRDDNSFTVAKVIVRSPDGSWTIDQAVTRALWRDKVKTISGIRHKLAAP